MFIVLICLILFAPALGLLFISYSNNLIEPNEYAEQNQSTHKIEILPKSKKMEQFKVGDIVECIDKKVKTDYDIQDKGCIVYLYDDSIGVVFQTKKGSYTLRLKEDQIK
jgi:ribosomal protein L21E